MQLFKLLLHGRQPPVPEMLEVGDDADRGRMLLRFRRMPPSKEWVYRSHDCPSAIGDCTDSWTDTVDEENGELKIFGKTPSNGRTRNQWLILSVRWTDSREGFLNPEMMVKEWLIHGEYGEYFMIIIIFKSKPIHAHWISQIWPNRTPLIPEESSISHRTVCWSLLIGRLFANASSFSRRKADGISFKSASRKVMEGSWLRIRLVISTLPFVP